MGKKNNKKNTTLASTSQNPPPPPPEPQLRKFRYDDIPENHKRLFRIYDDCGSVFKYVEIICWLRTMCTFDGSGFLGIRNLNWCGEGCPLLEVEVMSPQGLSAKFLIYKGSLYLIAFSAKNGFFQFFECEFDVEGCISLSKSYCGRYSGEPWNDIGPKVMIEAVNYLATYELNDVSNAGRFVEATEVFFFHLSEATRLYVVQSLVCKSLEHSREEENENEDIYKDEAERTLVALNGGTISEANDVYRYVEVNGYFKINDRVVPPSYMSDLLHKFGNLSKEWYTYALTKKKIFDMRDSDVSRFHIRSVKSLRSILAVLCNSNLEKLIPVLRKKVGQNGFTLEDYKDAVTLISDLKERKKVFVPIGENNGGRGTEKNQGGVEKNEKEEKRMNEMDQVEEERIKEICQGHEEKKTKELNEGGQGKNEEERTKGINQGQEQNIEEKSTDEKQRKKDKNQGEGEENEVEKRRKEKKRKKENSREGEEVNEEEKRAKKKKRKKEMKEKNQGGEDDDG